MTEEIVLKLAGIGVIAIACQWLAWWVKLPAILFLLLAGIVAGPVTGWLVPDELLGQLLFPIVSLGVAVILFEGSLTLKFKEIQGLERVVRRFVTSGSLITWIIVTMATHWLLEFSWQLSFLFGAVMVVTGPTVIMPMLRTVRPNAKISNILRWEGIVVDPLGALLAVIVFEFIILEQLGTALGHTLTVFAQVIFSGIVLGALAGYGFGVILRKHWMPEYLHNVATLSIVFGVFAASNHIQEESGLLTVTVMGMWLANMKDVHTRDILHFKESLSVLLISGLFILLAARINFTDVQALGWAGVAVFLVMQFVARPAKVLASTFGSSLRWQERAMLCWIAPRGIVAAAVIALFALRLEELNFHQANLLVPLAFMVIIGTVVLQSATASHIARLLNVSDPEPKGFLIIGANTVARAIGKALAEQNFYVQLTDSYWNNVNAARMQGLKVYYGSAVSEHSDQYLDLVGIGRMLGLAQQSEFNALAAQKYKREFGRNQIFTLADSADVEGGKQHTISHEHRGKILFTPEMTYGKMASLLNRGATIRTTRLSDDFTYKDYLAQYNNAVIPLFLIDPRKNITVCSAGDTIDPKTGWAVISLIMEPQENK